MIRLADWSAHHWRACLFGLGIVGLIIVAAATVDSVYSATEIGGDEHFELSKAMLWAKGYPLYSVIWNDHPPLHTIILGVLFKGFGSNIGVARSFAVCFGLLLLTGLFVVVKARLGIAAALLAAFCLVTAPTVFDLSISVMLELPAIATAVCALWPLDRWAKNHRLPWLLLSGVILAAAMQIKLTAAITAPALAIELLLASSGAKHSKQIKTALWNVTIWSATVISSFLFLGWLLGSTYEQLWNSHFSSATAQAAGTQKHPFSLSLMLLHLEGMWGAAIGLLVLAFRRHWRRLAFPLVLLVTAAVIHVGHRPWWYYYYLHFAIPLAWITAYGIAELYKTARIEDAHGFRSHRFIGLAGLVSGSLLLSVALIYGGTRLIAEIKRIRNLPRVGNSELLVTMKKYSGATKWVYTRSTVYPFHANLSVIPELAVLPGKRFWSGQITDKEVWNIVQEYRPEQLLLSNITPLEGTFGAKEFVETNYTMVCDAEAHRLYIANWVIARVRIDGRSY